MKKQDPSQPEATPPTPDPTDHEAEEVIRRLTLDKVAMENTAAADAMRKRHEPSLTFAIAAEKALRALAAEEGERLTRRQQLLGQIDLNRLPHIQSQVHECRCLYIDIVTSLRAIPDQLRRSIENAEGWTGREPDLERQGNLIALDIKSGIGLPLGENPVSTLVASYREKITAADRAFAALKAALEKSPALTRLQPVAPESSPPPEPAPERYAKLAIACEPVGRRHE